jgi:hypothetical protein
VKILGIAAVLVAVGLGGCTQGDTTVAGGDSHPKLPTGGFGASASAEMRAAAPDFRPVDYRLAPGAGKDAPKQAKAYRLAPTEVDRDRVRKIADAFGVKGEVEGTGGRDFLVSDGEANVDVVWDNVLSWSYGRSEVEAFGSVSSSCAPDGRCLPGAVVNEPASTIPGVPSAAEAEDKARTLLGQAGIDLDGTSASVHGDDAGGRYVTFAPKLGGVVALGLETVVSFGEQGRVQYAGGYLAKVEALGDYDLAGPATVLERKGSGGAAEAGEAEVVELTRVFPALVLVGDGCPGDPAYLVPAFLFGQTEADDQGGPGAGPIVAVADADTEPKPEKTCEGDGQPEPGLPTEEQRPVP